MNQSGNVLAAVTAGVEEVRQDGESVVAVAGRRAHRLVEARSGEFEKRGVDGHTATLGQLPAGLVVREVRRFAAAAVGDDDHGVGRCGGVVRFVRAGGGGVHWDNLTSGTEPRSEPGTIAESGTRPEPGSRHLEEIGIGPHAEPWPDDDRFDPELLAGGDRRNVIDRYRYWTVEAIVEDLDRRRHEFHVAIENWDHDFNIGTVVRNANAFLAARVHIIGRRRWNRRGAMVTDRYQHIEHHATIDEFVTWSRSSGLSIVGIDNLPGSVPLETTALPRSCVLLFGQEGPGLSEEARAAVDVICSITQFGSTRSINAGVASGIAMYAWTSQHAVRSGSPLPPA